MESVFQFKNMVPPEEVLPNGSGECQNLVDELASWFAKHTGETIAFDFPRRREQDGSCILAPRPHPVCSATSCPSGKECRTNWNNQFWLAKGSRTIGQWTCPGNKTVFVGSICLDGSLIGFGKVVLSIPAAPMHTTLIKSAVRGTLRELELDIENRILKHRLKSRGKKPSGKKLPVPDRNEGEHPAVAMAIDYIDEHYRDHALSLSTVAEAAGVSTCYLSSLFHDATGTAFHDHLRKLRRATAEELMETTSLTTSEIARRSGFSTSRNLHRALKHDGNSTDIA